MANDLLTTAIREAKLTRSQIADITGVDPKTVDRWIAGRVPHPRHRSVLAQKLAVPESELWPQSTRARRREGLEEITGAWARRDGHDVTDWRALLRQATSTVDLVGYSLMSILGTDAAIKALRQKAADGVSVRIAVADPTDQHVIAADIAAHGAGHLIARVNAAHGRLLELIGHPGVETRIHHVASCHAILRFDDQLLMTIHLHGTPGVQAPVLHISRHHDYGIFDQLTRHLEEVWQTAQPLKAGPLSRAEPEPAAAASSGADALLDRFDNVWRPGQTR